MPLDEAPTQSAGTVTSLPVGGVAWAVQALIRAMTMRTSTGRRMIEP
jgi:hypothetical protein